MSGIAIIVGWFIGMIISLAFIVAFYEIKKINNRE